MPVTHGDETAGLDAPRPHVGLQGARLCVGFRHERRAAADPGIDGAGDRRPPARDQLRQQPAERLREVDDRPVGEQVAEKRLHRRRPVGPAQVEQDDGDPVADRVSEPLRHALRILHPAPPLSQSRTIATTSAR